MESHRFEEAMAEFLPAARSGNADAEELIGVMYAMGLGVERDDERAFEWYLRASMKGHPGAQSGIGWYFEVGRGTAVDLVRAYLWYGLSAIGGDPDAAISIEDVAQENDAGADPPRPGPDRRLPAVDVSVPLIARCKEKPPGSDPGGLHFSTPLQPYCMSFIAPLSIISDAFAASATSRS
jgi:hypothetical protein